MKKVYRVEIEVMLDEANEQNAIRIARDHYLEVGGAEEAIEQQSDCLKTIPAEEFISDSLWAIVTLVNANPLLERAGVDVTEVSCHEAEDVDVNHCPLI